MEPLSLGKIPISVLKSTFLRLTGVPSSTIVTPPRAGLDFAALKAGSKYMLVSADPITGVDRDIGRYAMIVSANDIATSGNRAQFAESVVLLPEGADAKYARELARQMDAEAKRLKISIVGGHTEVTPGLNHPIVVVTAFSFVDDYVSSREARSGDTIMMTKTAGLEGTAVLSGERGLLDRVGVGDEAVAAYATGAVHAMHDCTEGGVLGAAFEMSLASGLGFELLEERVPVSGETTNVCRKLKLNPLKLIASGALLLSVEGGREAEVKKALSNICEVTPVGRFMEGGRVLIKKGGKRVSLKEAPEDELWRVLGRSSRRRRRL